MTELGLKIPKLWDQNFRKVYSLAWKVDKKDEERKVCSLAEGALDVLRGILNYGTGSQAAKYTGCTFRTII